MSLIQGTLKSAKNAKNNTDTNNADDILIKWTSKYFSTNRKTVREPNEKQAISKWRSIALYGLSYETHPIGKEVDHIPYKIAEKKCVTTTYDKDKNIVLITFDINRGRSEFCVRLVEALQSYRSGSAKSDKRLSAISASIGNESCL